MYVERQTMTNLNNHLIKDNNFQKLALYTNNCKKVFILFYAQKQKLQLPCKAGALKDTKKQFNS